MSIQQARQTADKLRETQEENQLEKDINDIIVRVEGELALPQEVRDFYKDHAHVGVEHVDQSKLPKLKLIQSNSEVELPDGTRPKLGSFHYAETDEIYDTLDAHILSFSRGFYTKSLNENAEKKTSYSVIVSGLMADDHRPFVIFISGLRLAPMWDWAKDELSKYTKKAGIPVYALRTQFSSHKEKNSFGKDSYILDFKVRTHEEDGRPILIEDLPTLERLNKQAEITKVAIENYIMAIECNKDGSDKYQKVQQAEVSEDYSNDTPF